MEGKLTVAAYTVAAYEEVETLAEMVARVMRLYSAEFDVNEQSTFSILPRLDESLSPTQTTSNKHA